MHAPRSSAHIRGYKGRSFQLKEGTFLSLSCLIESHGSLNGIKGESFFFPLPIVFYHPRNLTITPPTSSLLVPWKWNKHKEHSR